MFYMTEEILKNVTFDFKKILQYGFVKKKDQYVYEVNLLDNTFRAFIFIDQKGVLTTKLIDLETGLEYTNYKVKSQNGSFVQKVRVALEEVLQDILKTCGHKQLFLYDQTIRIYKKLQEEFHTEPEFLWKKYTRYAVFRNRDTHKWYAIFMNIKSNQLYDSNEEEIEILNVKVSKDEIGKLLKKDGIYPAYHMNKRNWISILLNDTLKDEEIIEKIKESYSLGKK